jgi:hypothetical protein
VTIRSDDTAHCRRPGVDPTCSFLTPTQPPASRRPRPCARAARSAIPASSTRCATWWRAFGAAPPRRSDVGSAPSCASSPSPCRSAPAPPTRPPPSAWRNAAHRSPPSPRTSASPPKPCTASCATPRSPSRRHAASGASPSGRRAGLRHHDAAVVAGQAPARSVPGARGRRMIRRLLAAPRQRRRHLPQRRRGPDICGVGGGGGMSDREPLWDGDYYDEDPCGGTGVVECWNPGGPCPVPNDPDCDTCGRCFTCAIDRDPT